MIIINSSEFDSKEEPLKMLSSIQTSRASVSLIEGSMMDIEPQCMGFRLTSRDRKKWIVEICAV